MPSSIMLGVLLIYFHTLWTNVKRTVWWCVTRIFVLTLIAERLPNSSSCVCLTCNYFVAVFLQEDIFSFNCVNLGPLSKVKVWHDNSGLKSAWNLDRIEIEDKLTEENYVFPCNRWLATSEDDGQICRELVVVDERARKLERRRMLSRKGSVISNVDGVDLEAKGLLPFL